MTILKNKRSVPGFPHRLIIFGLLVAMAVACLTSMRVKSPTYDESWHLGRGVAAVKSGDLRLSIPHPPLGNLLSALPMLAIKDLDVPFDDVSWEKADNFKFCPLLLQRNRDRAERMFFLSRTITVILALLLGILVFRFAREFYGPSAGILALVLFVMDPNILAHSRLVTTDLNVTLGIFAAVYVLARFLRNPSPKSLLLVGVVSGIANLFKYSAVLLYPIHGLILLYAATTSADFRERFRNGADPLRLPRILSRTPLRAAVVSWLILSALSVLVVWAGYGFEIKQISEILAPLGVEPEKLPRSGHIPLPLFSYLFGMFLTDLGLTRPTTLYFLGESRHSLWFFFIALFLLKTPIAMLILIPFSLYHHLRRRLNLQLVVLLVPAAIFVLVATVLVKRCLGLRYILPIYPFLHVLAAGLWDKGVPGGWYRRSIWALLLLWYLARTIQIHPDYLMYFNEFAGGPEQGYRYSAEGNDWGQDMKRLAQFMEKHRIEEIWYTPFNTITMDFYGKKSRPIPCRRVKSGWVAVHAVFLRMPMPHEEENCFNWLNDYTPVAKIGHTIFVYHFDEASPAFYGP